MGLFGVADGVGGLPFGAQAAQCVVDSLRSQISRKPLVEPNDWQEQIHQSNERVFLLGQMLSPSTGIASTCTCGLLWGAELWLAHVGDSRCYLVRGETVRCLTEDHSAENEARRNPDQPAPEEKWKLALVRVMGQPDAAQPDITRHAMEPGDHLLFATDGITRVIGDAEFPALIVGATAPAERLAQLIELTNDRGGPDNATAVLVEVLSPSTHDE
ncbi:MAG: hypothetical protein SynsKO_26180 [Synoicihabitans sp.]